MDFERKNESSKSLFEMASSKFAKKKLQQEVPKVKEEKIKHAQDDAKTLIARGQQLHEELERRIDHLLRFHDVSEQKFYKYLSNPKNFTEEEWKNLEAEREANRKKIEDLCRQMPSGGESALQKYLQGQRRIEKSVKEIQEKTSLETSEKVSEPLRKKKMVPKHRWLNMH